MKTQTFLRSVIIAVALLAAQAIFGQGTSKLSRKVLFTLGANESVWYSEYSAQTTLNGDKYALVLENEATKEFTFVFNGKRICTTNYDPYRPFDLKFLNLNEENGYSFLYSKIEGRDTTTYINIRGTTYGSFDEAELVSEDEYWYTLAGKWFYKTKKRFYGPFDGWGNITIIKNGKYALKYDKYNYSDNRWYTYININGRDLGSFPYLRDFQFTESEKYAFAYRDESDKYHVNINGVTSEPFDWYISDLTLHESGKYAFSYEDSKEKKKYLNIDGEKLEIPYNYFIDDFFITENGEFAYSCYDNSRENYKVNINGKVFGPYDYVSGLKLHESGKYIYAYQKDNVYHVVSNNQTWGPYVYTSDLTIDDNGNCSFDYTRNDGGWFNNITGKIDTSYSGSSYFLNEYDHQWDISSPDQQHSFYSNYEYQYVVIDGQKVGKSPAIRVWYDEQKNSFIWNAIEGKELLIYEYKL